MAENAHSHTRLSTVVLIRWLAIGGQTVTILLAQTATKNVALMPVFSTIAASALLNLGLTFASGAFRRLDEGRVARHLAFDIIQLSILIALTGGLSNPFSLFLLAPVTVAAATLSVRHVVILSALAVCGISTVARLHLPLPWPSMAEPLPILYVFGVWAALSLGVMSVSFFTWRMAQESRNMAAAYSESRIALAQEQRVAEVGALAAAVAHELNTPLGTICLLAREVANELPAAEVSLKSDMTTLLEQAERCRDILLRLTKQRDRSQAVGQECVSFPVLVEMAASNYVDDVSVAVVFDHHALSSQDAASPPWIERSPEILHGLGNFIQNATQFARSCVEIDTSWGRHKFSVRIADDGPGFPPHLLEHLGEPYISARSEDDKGHLGLGIFIATTLLARTGAKVEFSNGCDGGAIITVSWRRHDE